MRGEGKMEWGPAVRTLVADVSRKKMGRKVEEKPLVIDFASNGSKNRMTPIFFELTEV